MTIYYAAIDCELREVRLQDKPLAMLNLSEKGTVPVLHFSGQVIDESLQIMFWALNKSDPDNWLNSSHPNPLVTDCDGYFKYYLDRYKYYDRYPQQDQNAYFVAAKKFLAKLERQFRREASHVAYLCGNKITWVDVAIFPFIRQFAFVDKSRFDQLNFPKLQEWLEVLLRSELFLNVMNKNQPWQPGDGKIFFPPPRTDSKAYTGRSS